MLDASDEAMLVRDAGGRIVFANRAAAEALGRTADELTGLPYIAVAEPAEAARVLAADREVLDSGDPSLVRDPVDGEVAGAVREQRRFPVTLAGGQPAVLAISRDVSASVRAERAERESRSKSEFVASLSHEMRTPLTAIMGFGQLLVDPECGALNQRQRRYVGNIRSSARQLLELVNDALDLARIQAGQMHLQPECIDVASMLQDAVAMLRPLAESKSIQVQTSVPEALAARADRRRLQQAVLNLLSNAIKFTPTGGSIDVEAVAKAEAVEITVSDTGIGVPPDEHERIFEEFAQLECERSESEGTGLGLALARKLVHLMGGQLILVRSVPGRGSVFAIRLPAASSQPRST
jgi:PAS domain S-box-containing protein